MRRAIPLLLLAACSGGPAPGTGARELTVERIYGEPSLSGKLPWAVAWSPDSNLVTFIDDNKLWAWDGAERRVLIDFSEVKIADARFPNRPIGRAAAGRYFWSSASDAILLAQEGHLVVWTLATKEFRILNEQPGEFHDPKWSPDGRHVSFIRAHDVWVMPAEGGQAVQLTQGGSETFLQGELDWVYPEELGLGTGYWWSPDSTKIAYLALDESKVTRFPLVDWRPTEGRAITMFYPKAGGVNPKPLVGVVTLDGKSEWQKLPEDAEYVARVGWTPKGGLVIQTLNRAQNRLTVALDGAVARTEESDTWVDVGETLFLKDGRMVYTSEKSGRSHIYLEGKQLTSGEWDVTQIAGVDEKLGIHYITNERHLDRRVGCVTLDGVRLGTLGEGWTSLQSSPSGRLLRSRSSTTRPVSVDDFAPNDVPELAEYRLRDPEFVRVPVGGGVEVDAMLIKPRDFDASRRHPVIVHVYGGPGAQSVANRWGGRNYLWHQMMAQRGFVCVVMDNRASGARGPGEVRRMHKRLGTIEVADLDAGVAWLKKQPWVDGGRIGLWGWSYGGYLTCLAMTKLAHFKAGVAVAPVTRWEDYDTIYTERYMGRPQDNADGYRESAPVTHAANLSGRLLLAHGLNDDNVHFQNAAHFVDALVAAGKPFEQLVYPGRDHGIADRDARVHLFRAMASFFERELAR